jgi:hypothetical protein
MNTVANTYCVVLGTPGEAPLTIVGPFATEEEACAHAAEHEAKTPPVTAAADVLLAPVNCP